MLALLGGFAAQCLHFGILPGSHAGCRNLVYLGKLTLHIKAHEGDPVYYGTLQSPYTQNSVLSTVSWGGQQTIGVQLAIGIRCNGVVQKSLNLGVNSAIWGGWLTISGNKNNNKPFEEDTRIEVEFYLYTLNGMEFFLKDTPSICNTSTCRWVRFPIASTRTIPARR